jgi:hypothetical protein
VPEVKLQIPPLRFASVGMTKWRVALHLSSGGGGWTGQRRECPKKWAFLSAVAKAATMMYAR